MLRDDDIRSFDRAAQWQCSRNEVELDGADGTTRIIHRSEFLVRVDVQGRDGAAVVPAGFARYEVCGGSLPPAADAGDGPLGGAGPGGPVTAAIPERRLQRMQGAAQKMPFPGRIVVGGCAMNMTSMNISLPEPLKLFVEEQVSKGGYSTASEYLRELIREAQRRTDRQELEGKLPAGLQSPTSEMSSDDWTELRERVLTRSPELRGKG